MKIQYDNSGVGHNWRDIEISDLLENIAEEIDCWIIEDKPAGGDEYTATNGHHYRLRP